MSLKRIWLAGFVRRWHTNPDLAHTCDRLDGHCARVARIVMKLWPENTTAIRWALIHDDGEHVTGDNPATYPKDHDQMLTEASIVYDLWDQEPMDSLSSRRLCVADKLDAYLWAKHHAPHTLSGDGWPETLAWLEQEACALGVWDEIREML